VPVDISGLLLGAGQRLPGCVVVPNKRGGPRVLLALRCWSIFFIMGAILLKRLSITPDLWITRMHTVVPRLLVSIKKTNYISS
jgi:hypothetical protein